MARTALLLLPGLDGTGLLFAPLVEALPPSLLPMVAEYPADLAWGYEELQPLVDRLMPAEGRFLILGESFSGPLALRVAVGRPAGLAGVVLCATFVTNPLPLVPAAASVLLRPALFRLFPAASNAKALLGRRADSRHAALARQALAGVHPRALAARARAALRVDAARALAMCPVPILYLRGTRDLVVPYRNVRKVLDLRPDVEVVSLPAPHMLLQTRPVEAARAIESFARRVIEGMADLPAVVAGAAGDRYGRQRTGCV